jgi:hypothetical protein
VPRVPVPVVSSNSTMRPSVKPVFVSVVGASRNWALEPEVSSVRQPRSISANKMELPAVSGCASCAPLERRMSSSPVRLPLLSAVKLPERVTGPFSSKPVNTKAYGAFACTEVLPLWQGCKDWSSPRPRVMILGPSAAGTGVG